ncbi:MAG: hypothetical protein IT349_09310 [Candidatus Eisenbacteria bacterium]|nr:hypothetical protein [Candidatus Eisenbacteria bacterium]
MSLALRRFAIAAAFVLSSGLGLTLPGCSTDEAGRSADAALLLSLRVRGEMDGRAVEASPVGGGGGYTYLYERIDACASEVVDTASPPPVCAQYRFPEGRRDYRLELAVAPADYYRVTVEVRGTRSRGSAASESGLLMAGVGFATDVAEGPAQTVEVVLDDVVPRPSYSEAGGVITWPAVPGADSYIVLETPPEGTEIAHAVTTNGFSLIENEITSGQFRVRANLSLQGASAYSEPIQVGASLPAPVFGRVQTTGNSPVPCALVKLYACDGADTGRFEFTATNGTFTLPAVPAGSYSLVVIRAGCSDWFNPSGCITVNGPPGLDLGQVNLDCPAPIWASFTVTWRDDPPDLDAHLWTPAIRDTVYHVSFSERGSARTAPYAELDHDETSGYGPENITIYQPSAGTYTLSIYHWCSPPGSLTLSQSGAEVRICKPDGTIQVVTVPQIEDEPFYWWNVCTVDGTTGAVNVVNTITAEPPLPSDTCGGLRKPTSRRAR